jgi:hypothetical protein
MSSQTPSPKEVKTRKKTPGERRGAVRIPCFQECLVWPEGASPVGAWSGMVYNISTSGVGLALAYPVQEGTILVIEPWGRKAVRSVRARVVRSSREAFVWFYGCELTSPLSGEEVETWRK